MSLSWLPPTENVDGTAIGSLAGYRIYSGRSRYELAPMVEIDNAGVTRYVIDDLENGMWYFAVSAVATDGTESARSNVAAMEIT